MPRDTKFNQMWLERKDNDNKLNRDDYFVITCF